MEARESQDSKIISPNWRKPADGPLFCASEIMGKTG